MNLLANPELRRNYRAQLRPGRMAAVAGIALALSLTFGYSYAQGEGANSPPGEWGRTLFLTAIWAQALALVIGGGFTCLTSISREKEQNTFDFQRVTRLTPLELALGKLLGAPALAYFAVLCLMPAALVGVVVGRLNPLYVAAAYVVLFVCSLTWHSIALLVSLLMERNSASAGGLVYLVLLGFGSFPDYGAFGLGMLSPFFAVTMTYPEAWTASTVAGVRYVDTFFGFALHHGAVLAFLSAAFLAWFLLVLARNIKRDPATYEVYSPAQAMGFAVFLNVILLGFFEWDKFSPHVAHRLLLFFNLSLFFGLGVAVMRTRDRLRRRIHEQGAGAQSWLAALWPATYLLIGFGAIGSVVTTMANMQVGDRSQWSVPSALVLLSLVSFWLARDVLFLQWMVLTRVKRPLTMGVLYLIVYYTCMAILLATLGMMASPARVPFGAIFIPSFGFQLDAADWAAHSGAWLLALAAQVPVVLLLAMLHRQKLLELSPRSAAPVAAPVSAD